MQLQMCNAKIHRATVTDANIDYLGSITIGENLLRESGIIPYQLVHINNLSNAAHWETYVISGGDNKICLNGASARLFQKGDKITILSIGFYRKDEMDDFKHTSVYVDDNNGVVSIESVDKEREPWYV